MGQCREFICPKCGYDAVVSGGDDRGFHVWTTTIVCVDCRALYDVVWREDPGRGRTPTECSLVCPGVDPDDEETEATPNPDHRVRKWEAPGPCPRCGTTMEVGGEGPLWD